MVARQMAQVDAEGNELDSINQQVRAGALGKGLRGGAPASAGWGVPGRRMPTTPVPHVWQVDALEAAAARGQGFNQPQYLALKEMLAGLIANLDGMQARCGGE